MIIVKDQVEILWLILAGQMKLKSLIFCPRIITFFKRVVDAETTVLSHN